MIRIQVLGGAFRQRWRGRTHDAFLLLPVGCGGHVATASALAWTMHMRTTHRRDRKEILDDESLAHFTSLGGHPSGFYVMK